MDRQELVVFLGAGMQKAQRGGKRRPSSIRDSQSEVLLAPEPLSAEASGFWGSSLPDDLFGEVLVPPAPAALVKRLGSFPFWRSEERFLSAIEPIYAQASPRGLDIFLGERDSK